MAKRRADKELTHDNWNDEDDSPVEDISGPFKRASDEELSRRKIKTARRRGVTSEENTGPSVFKNFAGFGNIASGGGSKLPSFDFMGKKSTESGSSAFAATAFKLPTSTVETAKSEVSFKMPTQSSNSPPATNFSFGSKTAAPVPTNKTNGVGASSPTKTSSSSNLDANDKLYLANLKTLNEGVVKWIQKHVQMNSYVSLIPVFDDYKKHFTKLEEKYKPKFSKKTGSEVSAPSNGSAAEKPADSFSFKSTQSKTNVPSSPVKTVDITAIEPALAKTPEIKFSFKPTEVTATKSPAKSGEAKEAPTFSFGSSDKSSSTTTTTTTNPGTFSFGSSTTSESSTPTFNFGGGASSTAPSKGFSFAPSSGPLTFGAKESTLPASSKGFSFGSSAPPFQFNPAPPTSTSTTTGGGEDPEYTPPQPDVLEVKEENSVYDKKCKLFYKSEGNFVDKGVGTLFLKPVPDSTKTQLIVRAATSLGNVLLNIILNPSMPTQRMGKNNVLIVCVPNPPIDPKRDNKTPVSMLIRVKTGDDADELLKKIDEFKKK